MLVCPMRFTRTNASMRSSNLAGAWYSTLSARITKSPSTSAKGSWCRCRWYSTRASAEYLNGGRRSVARPSSSESVTRRSYARSKTRSGANQLEHLVALLLHQRKGHGLEVEAQQGLGVRRAD